MSKAYVIKNLIGNTKTFTRGKQDNIILIWVCLSCDFSVDVEAPGYAGDGYDHYNNDNTPCGPLIAYRV